MRANGFRKAGTWTALAALCACLVPAGVALAGYQDGGFEGETEQAEPFGFRVADGKVRRLESAVYAECLDGTRQRVSIEKGRTDMLDDRFTLVLVGAGDLKAIVTGKLRGSRASGRIEAVLRPGDTICRADVRWQAALPDAAA